MRHALQWIREHLLQHRPELFLAGDSVCVRCLTAGDAGCVRAYGVSARGTTSSPYYGLLPSHAHSPAAVPPRSRPGILVLINEVDWELEGTLDYCLQPSDALVFISTLHGG